MDPCMQFILFQPMLDMLYSLKTTSPSNWHIYQGNKLVSSELSVHEIVKWYIKTHFNHTTNPNQISSIQSTGQEVLKLSRLYPSSSRAEAQCMYRGIWLGDGRCIGGWLARHSILGLKQQISIKWHVLHQISFSLQWKIRSIWAGHFQGNNKYMYLKWE